MQKLSAKWVPKCFNADQEQNQAGNSKLFRHNLEPSSENIVERLVTVDEAWLLRSDPETKQQSGQWRLPDSPWAKKSKTLNSAAKVIGTVYFSFGGGGEEDIVMIDCLQTVNAEYNSNLLCRLNDELKEKRWQNLRKVLFFFSRQYDCS